jgi:hypothetical protein
MDLLYIKPGAIWEGFLLRKQNVHILARPCFLGELAAQTKWYTGFRLPLPNPIESQDVKLCVFQRHLLLTSRAWLPWS